MGEESSSLQPKVVAQNVFGKGVVYAIAGIAIGKRLKVFNGMVVIPDHGLFSTVGTFDAYKGLVVYVNLVFVMSAVIWCGCFKSERVGAVHTGFMCSWFFSFVTIVNWRVLGGCAIWT
jgi:hypothetical protein